MIASRYASSASVSTTDNATPRRSASARAHAESSAGGCQPSSFDLWTPLGTVLTPLARVVNHMARRRSACIVQADSQRKPDRAVAVVPASVGVDRVPADGVGSHLHGYHPTPGANHRQEEAA